MSMNTLSAITRRVRGACVKAAVCGREFLRRREEGASLVEYALLVALIAVALIATLKLLAGGIINSFTNAINNL